jgi:hypothetical protein
MNRRVYGNPSSLEHFQSEIVPIRALDDAVKGSVYAPVSTLSDKPQNTSEPSEKTVFLLRSRPSFAPALLLRV